MNKRQWRAFWKRLDVMLQEANMNQSKLAMGLGVKQSAISQWVRCQTNPASWRIKEIVRWVYKHHGFKTPLELLDWVELICWQPTEEEMQEWFPRCAAPARGPVLKDQQHLFRSVGRLVGRNKELGQVKRWLTAVEAFRRPAVKVVVIWGMAGVGKTALAQAVGQDPAVERYFRDGVLWAKLGPEPDIEKWLQEWGNLLGLPDADRGSMALLYEYLASEERRALLILDDVWPSTPFEQLMALGGPQCGVLITSQVITVADVYDEKSKVRKLRLKVLRPKSALELARQALKREPMAEETAQLKEIIKRVEGLPLAVPGVEPQQLDSLATFQVGYQRLNEADQQRFRALGNLPRGTSFQVGILAALWGDEVEEARQAAQRLVERSLLNQIWEDHYRIHVLLHDSAIALLKAAGEQDMEGAWVEAWANRFRGGLVKNWRLWWPSLPQPRGRARLFSRTWLMWVWEELRVTMFQCHWDVIQTRLVEKMAPAEVWATGQLLHRRAQRHLRHGRIFIETMIGAMWLVVLTLASWIMLATSDWELAVQVALNWSLFRWLYDLTGILALVYLLGCPLWVLITGVDLVDFHRFYRLPLGRYGSAADKKWRREWQGRQRQGW
jgi:hypothetical protein